MFFPQAMTEIELIIPDRDLLAVTNLLAGQGIFHQVDASHFSSRVKQEAGDISWKERAAAYATLERQIMALMQSLGVQEGSPSVDQAKMVEPDEARPLVEKIELAVKDTTGQLSANEKRLGQLEGYIHELEPVADINLDIGLLRDPRYLHSILGTMPVSHIDRLETSLARTPFVLMPLREDRKDAVVWLTGAKANSDILDRAARSAYLDPFDFSEVREGTPAEIIQSLRNDVADTQAAIEKQKAEIEQLRNTYEKELQPALWSVRTSRMLADSMARFGKLKYTYLIVGWVPSVKVPALSQQLKSASPNIIIDTTPSKRSDGQNVPVSLRNPGFLGAFEMLVDTYSHPRYEEVDPTILIAFTFPLLFGIMFGDFGQGIILALFGLLIASKRVAALRSMASLGTIITTCGISAMVFGLIYGSSFGLEGEKNPLLSIPFFKQLVLIEPLHQATLILGIAVGIGVVFLASGFLLNLYNAWRARDWVRLFLDHRGLLGLFTYISLLGLLTGLVPHFPIPFVVFAVMAVVALVLVFFSEPLKHLVEGHRPLIEGGIMMFAIQAGVELFEVLISSVSNTVSFARLGGFALAHAGLSLAVYTIAGLVGGAPGVVGVLLYWIVVVLGNLFIIGFEGMIVGIQTMRLHYYEFFNKFFTGGGQTYDPLAPLRAQEKPQN